MTSVVFILGEGSSSVALSKIYSLFFAFKVFLGVFPDPMGGPGTEDLICVQVVKPSEAHLSFVILGYTN